MQKLKTSLSLVFSRQKQLEVTTLESQIRQKKELQKKAGIELESTCQICLKTKFADGVGHVCNYCTVRCCARCGGKVALRSAKVIWVCILCRKKQELLIKTGTWMQSKANSGDPVLRKIEEDMSQQYPAGQGPMSRMTSGASTPLATPSASSTISSLFSRAMSIGGGVTPTNPGPGGGLSYPSTPPAVITSPGQRGFARGGRARFERGTSLDRALPSVGEIGGGRGFGFNPRMGMAGGGVYRQRSLEGSADSLPANYMMMMGGRRTPTLPMSSSSPHPPPSSASSSSFGMPRNPLLRRLSEGGENVEIRSFQRQFGSPGRGPHPPAGVKQFPPGRGGFHRTMSTSAMGVGSTTAGMFSSSASFSSRPGSQVSTPMSANAQPLAFRRSNLFVHESMSAPEDAGGRESASEGHPEPSGGHYPRVLVSDSEARDLCPPLSASESQAFSSAGGAGYSQAYLPQRRQSAGLLDPRTARRTVNRRKLDSTFRNDSLSSDQSECVRPPPPKPHKQRRNLPEGGVVGGRSGNPERDPHRHRSSLASSSDEEFRSTPDHTSCGEEEMESESVSEKGRSARN